MNLMNKSCIRLNSYLVVLERSSFWSSSSSSELLLSSELEDFGSGCSWPDSSVADWKRSIEIRNKHTHCQFRSELVKCLNPKKRTGLLCWCTIWNKQTALGVFTSSMFTCYPVIKMYWSGAFICNWRLVSKFNAVNNPLHLVHIQPLQNILSQ